MLRQVRFFVGVVYSWVDSILQEEIDRRGKGTHSICQCIVPSINQSIKKSITINVQNIQSINQAMKQAMESVGQTLKEEK